MNKPRENRAKVKLSRNEPVVCIGGQPIDSGLVDLLGSLGFDAVRFDMEHGDCDYGDIPNLTRAADLWGMTSIVRVGQNDPGSIYRILDLGAFGVQVPHVCNVEDAQKAVHAAKFHPVGARGVYPGRQSYGVSDYLQRANEATLVIVSIEDVQAIDRLKDILLVEHIDVFHVASRDLAQSMGYVGHDHPQVREMVRRVISQIAAAGRIAGTPSSPSEAMEHYRIGARFLTMNWSIWLREGPTTLRKAIEAVSP